MTVLIWLQALALIAFGLIILVPELFTRRMSIGTKSLLFGAHQFILHPIAVFRAWWHLYGFPYDPRLWVAFVVHDWGYVGKTSMDGPDGKEHPELGASIMGWLFGYKWAEFSLFHSRSYAKLHQSTPSKLCHADKLAFCYQWRWAYLTGTRFTGEINEYLENAEKYNRERNYSGWLFNVATTKGWYRCMEVYMREHAYKGAFHRPKIGKPITVKRPAPYKK